jgi:putative FmdB family regulatory protein
VPTYQYSCTTCGHALEVVQSFSDDPLTECPECQGRLRKVFGSVGVVFKGPGFYRTDSRAAARNGRSESAKGGKGGGGADGAPAKETSGKEASGKEASGTEGGGTATADGGGATKAAATAGTAGD